MQSFLSNQSIFNTFWFDIMQSETIIRKKEIAIYFDIDHFHWQTDAALTYIYKNVFKLYINEIYTTRFESMYSQADANKIFYLLEGRGSFNVRTRNNIQLDSDAISQEALYSPRKFGLIVCVRLENFYLHERKEFFVKFEHNTFSIRFFPIS